MNIPTPFARRRRPAEPDPVFDFNIPFGVHPLVDYIRFSLMLLQNQVELSEEYLRLRRSARRLRWSIILMLMASFIVSVLQGVQIWLNWINLR